MSASRKSLNYNPDADDFDPNGNPDEGINLEILQIKLAKESNRWDEMVNRVNVHLHKTIDSRLTLKGKQKKKQLAEQLEIQKKQEEVLMRKLGTKQKKEITQNILGNLKKDLKQDLREKKQSYDGHTDQHGNKYMQAYDKTLAQGDDDYGQDKMQKMFDGLTWERVFSREEIELVACAYKSQLKEVRSAIKNIDLLETKSKFDNKKLSMEKYKNGLIFDLCLKGKRQIDSLEKYCVQVAASPLPLIFFLKLQADIYRYMAEHTQKYTDIIEFSHVLPEHYIQEQKAKDPHWELDHKNQPLKIVYKDEAWKHYKKARFISKRLADKIAYSENKETNQIDSIQLGLALNYAVFLWEIIQTPEMKKYALRHLKRVIQRALDDFDQWNKEESEKIAQQVELIQENIKQWQDEGVNTDSEEEN